MKDGGPDSTVTGYWLIEWKSVFSIVLLKFEGRSRDMYHSHAFNAVSWVLKGNLVETVVRKYTLRNETDSKQLLASIIPVNTPRHRFHKVNSVGTSWVLSFRGPWNKYWYEYDSSNDVTYELTSGRKRRIRTLTVL